MNRWAFAFGLGLLLAACGGEEAAQETVAMPMKEKTWVKTEKVELTKEEFLAKQQEEAIPVKVDDALKKQLMTPAALPTNVVRDSQTCQTAVRPLEQKRKELQRAGGMWHAFERAAQVRPYSNNGMQLDSNLNKLVFAVGRLCGMADGTPMSPFARDLSALLEKRGEKETRLYLSRQGRAPKDIDKWIQYARDSQTAATQKIPFTTIEENIRQTIPLVQKYEDLYRQEVNDSNKTEFVQEAVTLLAVVNDRIENVPELARALKEDFIEPHFKFEGEM